MGDELPGLHREGETGPGALPPPASGLRFRRLVEGLLHCHQIHVPEDPLLGLAEATGSDEHRHPGPYFRSKTKR